VSVRAVEADPESLLLQAAEADATAADLERLALDEGDLSIDLAAVDKHKERARSLRFGAQAARRRLERKAADERLADLQTLHSEIVARAERIETGAMDAALDAVRKAAAAFTNLVAEHDSAVRALRLRAHGHGVHGFLPSGPAEADGFIATGGDSVTAGSATLRVIGSEDAAEMAVRAACGERVRVPAGSMVAPPRNRPKFVLVNRSGAYLTMERLNPGTADLLAKGDLVALDAAQIDRYMAGDLSVDPGQPEKQRAAQMAASADRRASLAQATALQQQAAQMAMGV